MAVTIIRISEEDRINTWVAESLTHGQLPPARYIGGGAFDTLHEPLDHDPCIVVIRGHKLMCANEEHLCPIGANEPWITADSCNPTHHEHPQKAPLEDLLVPSSPSSSSQQSP